VFTTKYICFQKSRKQPQIQQIKQKMEKKPLTIRNVLLTDKQYLDDLSVTMNVPVAEALSYIINKVKTTVNTPETPIVTAEEKYKLEREITLLSERLKEVQAENVLLNEREPEIKEVTVEKEVQVEMKLKGAQFICELEENVASAARKIRSFAKQDGFINKDIADKDYPNALANISVKQFINRHYSDKL
jgi:hypothetical protein